MNFLATTTLHSCCCSSSTSPYLITTSPFLYMCYMQNLHSSAPPFQRPLILAAPSCAPAKLPSRVHRRPFSKLSTTAHTDFLGTNDNTVHILYQFQYTSTLQGALDVPDAVISTRVDRKPFRPDPFSRPDSLPLLEQLQLDT
jgi:hypothetical protein